MSESGIVYVLTNAAMPGLVKIGKTSRESVDARLGELYGTGVPVPFECEYAGRVDDETKVEKAFHQAFGPYRLNPRREFFQIDADQAIALLSLIAVEDVTPQIQLEANGVDVGANEAKKTLKAKRPNFDFLEMGLEIGSVLNFVDSDAFCEVVTSKKVLFEGAESSLTAVTRELLGLNYSVQPSKYWMHHGRNLRELYDETYVID